MNTDQLTATNDAVGVIGQRVLAQLLNGKRSRLLKCKFSANVNITVAGTGIKNRGSVLALLDQVGLDQGGTDKMVMDARIARFFSEVHSPSALPATRLANANIQNVLLEETFYVLCAMPFLALPMETSFIEENIQNTLSAFLQYNGDFTKIIAGAATVAITNPTLKVQQVYDDRRPDLPLLLPFVRQVTQDVPGTNDALKIDLRGSRYLGALVVQQDTSGAGEVTDIINKLTLRGDGRDIIGPRAIPWADLVDHQAVEFGGSVSGTRAYWCYHFLKDGKLSKLLHPASYTNLRLELDVQASVTAGAGTSKVRVAMFEYESKPGLTVLPLPFEI